MTRTIARVWIHANVSALTLLALTVSVLALPSAAMAARDRAEPSAGPPLSVPQERLDAALTCSEDLHGATRDPVLLTPAFSTDQESYGWNYLRTLPAAGIPTCSLSLPDRGYGDLQIAAEFVVNAVRRMHEESGRKVALIGHQHGALDELWALMHWPDLPAKVSDVIAMATPFQGTTTAKLACRTLKRCPPAAWQIAAGSRFLEVINSRPLPSGVAHTSIATRFDTLIVPQPRASRLEGASNVVLQDICPLRPVEHFTILGDNLTYRLVSDALDHPGPADARRIPAGTCLTTTMPGTSFRSAPDVLRGGVGALLGAATRVPTASVSSEPPISTSDQGDSVGR